MSHAALTIVCTLGILAVIPAMSVQYREFLDRTGGWASARLTVYISLGALVIWLVVSFLVPGVSASPLEYPTGALAAVSAFLASMTVRDTTSRALPAVLFSLGWVLFVFTPIALAVLFPTDVGIPITAGPLDLGGALPVQVAFGAGALVVLTFARRWAIENRAHARPRSGLLIVCGAVIWAGWILGFVGLESQLDAVITPRIVENSIIAPICAVAGWIIGQRIVAASTNVSGAIAGLICGIVAISAGSAYFEPLWAGVTGIAAGLTCSVFVYRRIGKTGRHAWFIVGAHLIGASVGLIAVGLFGDSIGFIYDGQLTLVETQIVSTLIAIAWAGVVASLLWLALRRTARRHPDPAPSAAAPQPRSSGQQ